MTAAFGDIFTPGEKVRQSGIYLAMHDDEHVPAHEVVCVNGMTFPSCNRCGVRSRFTLVRIAMRVEQSEHFS